MENLLSLLGIDDSDGRLTVNLGIVIEALQRIYQTLAATRTLNELVMLAIKAEKNILFLQHRTLDSKSSVKLAVLDTGQIKTEISCSLGALTHDEGIIFVFVGVDNKVSIRSFSVRLGTCLPKRGILNKSDLDQLNKLGFKAVT